MTAIAASGLTFAASGLAPFSEADQFITDGFLKSEAGANFVFIIKDIHAH